MAADVRPGQCLLVGALGPWIIENVDVQPQSTVPAGAGCLRRSPAVQSENSRSVLAGWLPLGDATSSLAGTDRSVTSLIRTQLHRHIKGFPPFLYQEWNHNPWDISAPAPRQKKGGKSFTSYFLSEGKEKVDAAAKVLGHFCASAAEVVAGGAELW